MDCILSIRDLSRLIKKEDVVARTKSKHRLMKMKRRIKYKKKLKRLKKASKAKAS